jgi:hypothetical protein
MRVFGSVLGAARRAVVAASALLLAWAAPSPAIAAFVFTYAETASGVTLTGSGTINTAGLTLDRGGVMSGIAVRPVRSFFSVGTLSGVWVYKGITGSTGGYGPGGLAFPTTSSGDGFYFQSYVHPSAGIVRELGVPEDYVSGAPLSNTMVFAGATFASMGLKPGTYVWTWGSAGNADSLTVSIPAIPEPASAALLAVGLLGLAASRRRRMA